MPAPRPPYDEHDVDRRVAAIVAHWPDVPPAQARAAVLFNIRTHRRLGPMASDRLWHDRASAAPVVIDLRDQVLDLGGISDADRTHT